MQVDFQDEVRSEDAPAPAGVHQMEFRGISDPIEVTNKFKETPGDPDTLIKRVATFSVVDGEHAGKVAKVWFTDQPGLHEKSNKTKLIRWLLGGPIPKEGTINTDELIGSVGSAVLEATDNGGSKMISFIPSPDVPF